MRWVRLIRLAGFAVAAWAVCAGAGAAETAELFPAADTALFEFDPDYNFGAQRDVPAGTLGVMAQNSRSRMLLRFDLASVLPAGAQIVEAELELTVVRAPRGGRNSVFTLHRVLRSWGEGAQRGDNPGGAPAAEGEATWVHRAPPGEAWGVPGGLQGADYEAESAAAQRVGDEGAYLFPFSEFGVEALQWQLDHPEEAHGWMLKTVDESLGLTARRFGAREHRTDPPRLMLRYARGPEPPAPVLTIRLDGAVVRMGFQAVPGWSYTLQRGAGVAAGDWEDWVTFPPVTEPETLEAADAAGGALSRFYRLAVRGTETGG